MAISSTGNAVPAIDVLALSDTAHYGSLTVNSWDGFPARPKKITSYKLYGHGRATLKGIKKLTGWSSKGKDLWAKRDTSLPGLRYFQLSSLDPVRYKYFLNGIFINGERKQVARTPNSGAFTTDGWL
jgi:hypothetical protein